MKFECFWNIFSPQNCNCSNVIFRFGFWGQNSEIKDLHIPKLFWGLKSIIPVHSIAVHLLVFKEPLVRKHWKWRESLFFRFLPKTWTCNLQTKHNFTGLFRSNSNFGLKWLHWVNLGSVKKTHNLKVAGRIKDGLLCVFLLKKVICIQKRNNDFDFSRFEIFAGHQ